MPFEMIDNEAFDFFIVLLTLDELSNNEMHWDK